MSLQARERNFLIAVRDNGILRCITNEDYRMRQALRLRGYVEFTGRPRKWHITEAGRKALNRGEA